MEKGSINTYRKEYGGSLTANWGGAMIAAFCGASACFIVYNVLKHPQAVVAIEESFRRLPLPA